MLITTLTFGAVRHCEVSKTSQLHGLTLGQGASQKCERRIEDPDCVSLGEVDICCDGGDEFGLVQNRVSLLIDGRD